MGSTPWCLRFSIHCPNLARGQRDSCLPVRIYRPSTRATDRDFANRCAGFRAAVLVWCGQLPRSRGEPAHPSCTPTAPECGSNHAQKQARVGGGRGRGMAYKVAAAHMSPPGRGAPTEPLSPVGGDRGTRRLRAALARCGSVVCLLARLGAREKESGRNARTQSQWAKAHAPWRSRHARRARIHAHPPPIHYTSPPTSATASATHAFWWPTNSCTTCRRPRSQHSAL